MNKLVSRNPVQRFKQGRKILKGADGLGETQYYYLGNNGIVGIHDQIQGIKNDKRLTQRYSFNGKQYGSFDGGKQYYDLSSGKPLNSKSNQYLISKIGKSGNTPPAKEKAFVTPKTGKIAKDWDTEFQNNFTNTLTQAQRAYLDSKGVDYSKAANVQEFLMKQLRTNLGGYKNDGKWGTNSINAWKEFAANNIPDYISSPTPPTSEQLVQQATKNTPVVEEVPQAGTNTIQNQLSLMQQTLPATGTYIQTPTTYNFDRTQTRQWLRNNGFNPYSLTGAQRKALRMILNGQGTEQDKNLIGLTGGLTELLTKYNYLKKGGNLLPSRNIVKRFKLQQGNKLPTAPKAEDRFRNGVKDSVAYLGVPGKDNSYFGESIKRVTTPDNAAIQRQILFRHYPHDNDTIYTEVPEHTKRLSIFPQVNIIPRKGFSFAQTPEYEILKRRFNTAWNLAK